MCRVIQNYTDETHVHSFSGFTIMLFVTFQPCKGSKVKLVRVNECYMEGQPFARK